MITKEKLKNYANKLMFDMNDEEYETLQKEFDVVLKQMDLIGNIEDMVIFTSNNNNCAEFNIRSNSEYNLKKIYDSLNTTSFSIYNTTYNIYMEINNDVINTKICEATS